MNPYVFCVTQGIQYNESIPLAITIARSESKELYSTMFEHFKDLTHINWAGRVVLSDMGAALIAVCSDYSIIHFFCHRHIIEHFGSSSPLGFFVLRLLKCHSLEECYDTAAQIDMEIEEYTAIYKQKGEVPSTVQKKIDEIKQMLMLDKGDPESLYYFTRWALWIRRIYHVATCSNHNESLHQVINRTTGAVDFICQLENLIYVVLKHYRDLKTRKGKSINRKVYKLMQIFKNLLSRNNFDLSEIKECDCEENIYNQLIYGAPIPCKHQLIPNITILKNLEQLLAQLNCDIPFKDCIQKLLDKPRSANQIIVNLGLSPMDPFVVNDVKPLIQAFWDSLRFPSPEIHSPSLNWDFNHYQEIGDEVEKIEAPPRNQNDAQRCPPIDEFPNENKDLEFVIKPEYTPNFIKSKRAIGETIYEINKLYPNGKCAVDICYSIYEQHKDLEAIENDLINWITSFKLDCWQEADRVYKSSRFFPSK